MKLLNNLKNVWYIFAVVALIMVFVFGLLAHQSCSNSNNLELIKSTLNIELSSIKKEIDESKSRENALLEGQEKLDTALYDKTDGILSKLEISKNQIDMLEQKLNQRPAPVDPATFDSLNECQKGYEELSESYDLCQELNNSKDGALVLFSKVKENLLSQVALLKGGVEELKKQVLNFEKIESTVLSKMQALDKAHRVNKFWKNAKNIGIGVGAAAVIMAAIKLFL